MSRETALLTFGIGPVHSFIAQARRVSDVWAGSYLLSDLTRQAIRVIKEDPDSQMIFPYLEGANIPEGLPNRFVCRIPLGRAEEIAQSMKSEIERVWDAIVRGALRDLGSSLSPSPSLWQPDPKRPRQTDRLLDIVWSWVPENPDYSSASLEGARRFTASRNFRPFSQIQEKGEKCAICGERTALPNGDRADVKKAWQKAEQEAKEKPGSNLARFLREDQGRLCLVCATKRFFPLDQMQHQRFAAFDEFQPSQEAPYFALVKLDGDRMGSILGLDSSKILGGDLEGFHREVSKALTEFADGLRIENSADLNLAILGNLPIKRPPQLIYAGGDDVLLICDPRDALPLVRRIRERYLAAFKDARTFLKAADELFTISAAVLFAHPTHAAGVALQDLEDLLKYGAKARAGRDAVALRLVKRGGVPVEVAFRWSDPEVPGEDWIGRLDSIVSQLREGKITSGQSFNLRLEERTLLGVFKKDEERWQRWLADRLERNEAVAGDAKSIASQVAPFFIHDHAPALRIARFLGLEVER
ncbi:MAG: type III-B CRISPR-associated protein Cas10/Cmr2 [Thermoanaerobaculia bacterium]